MFCFLKPDQKTFDYLLLYNNNINENVNKDAIVILDNRIQSEEINLHFQLNKITINKKLESLKWVDTYGKDFRLYLSSIKELFFMWKAVSLIHNKELTWELFCNLIDIYNKYKDRCLEKIF